ncbi:stage V sporulation protein AA [Pseudalkalibacillus caeni]|uniref:Stage V sporulation protein AA n=1 Tax=Exobacillus caeni TaxID=2574798 RepID=A0A5R9EX61_9BACL|nr:stage V sporulation protein AA [Pseudalkalibacillus caeni]TLS35657.1 stage V sporulation protein AA [Pseudalkalibacillus caeni]
MASAVLYLRMRQKLKVKPQQLITVGDLAQLISSDNTAGHIAEMEMYRIKPSDKNLLVVDVMKVVEKIQEHLPALDIQTIGPAQTIVEIQYPKRRVSTIYFILIWFLLFIGSGLAIMNFHEDVSMQEVHQRIYRLITGIDNPTPLMLQIPYSLGLGIGMVLFFNHLFRKRFNEEPSPLEVEMFNYQQDLDLYIIMHENKESEKNLNDK